MEQAGGTGKARKAAKKKKKGCRTSKIVNEIRRSKKEEDPAANPTQLKRRVRFDLENEEGKRHNNGGKYGREEEGYSPLPRGGGEHADEKKRRENASKKTGHDRPRSKTISHPLLLRCGPFDEKKQNGKKRGKEGGRLFHTNINQTRSERVGGERGGSRSKEEQSPLRVSEKSLVEGPYRGPLLQGQGSKTPKKKGGEKKKSSATYRKRGRDHQNHPRKGEDKEKK